jgi:hypothetical protein
VQEQGHEHLRRWLNDEPRLSAPWRDGSQNELRVARLTPAELLKLSKELDRVVGKYTEREPAPGRRNIEIQLNVFPLGDPE